MSSSHLLDDILAREGGYVDDPVDRGGATNFGITQATLRWWRKDPLADVRTLTVEEAREILTAMYIEGPGLHKIPDPQVQAFMVDFAVHSGPAIAIKHLQAAVGTEQDGVLGPLTLDALQREAKAKVLNRLVQSRCLMISRLVIKAPKQLKFLGGWLKRVLSFLDT